MSKNLIKENKNNLEKLKKAFPTLSLEQERSLINYLCENKIKKEKKMEEELKTSAEWSKLCNMLIVDPDGWDRSPEGWHYSWHKELITAAEFEKRACASTIIARKKCGDSFWME